MSGLETKDLHSLLTKSSMLCALMAYAHSSKLEIEAGTLSFLPQYNVFDKKKVFALFGAHVRQLVMEANDLRLMFLNDEEDLDVMRGVNIYAKNIYMYQCYVDLVDMFTVSHEHFIIDGVKWTIEGEKVINGSDSYSIPEFHLWCVETIKWKMSLLDYFNSDIDQAIKEVIKQYREQKGFVFDVELNYENADTDESPADSGVTG